MRYYTFYVHLYVFPHQNKLHISLRIRWLKASCSFLFCIFPSSNHCSTTTLRLHFILSNIDIFSKGIRVRSQMFNPLNFNNIHTCDIWFPSYDFYTFSHLIFHTHDQRNPKKTKAYTRQKFFAIGPQTRTHAHRHNAHDKPTDRTHNTHATHSSPMSRCWDCSSRRLCFTKLKLLLLAIEIKGEGGSDSKISINPRGAKIAANTQGFFIAQSADEVKRWVPGYTHVKSSWTYKMNFLILRLSILV